MKSHEKPPKLWVFRIYVSSSYNLEIFSSGMMIIETSASNGL